MSVTHSFKNIISSFLKICLNFLFFILSITRFKKIKKSYRIDGRLFQQSFTGILSKNCRRLFTIFQRFVMIEIYFRCLKTANILKINFLRILYPFRLFEKKICLFTMELIQEFSRFF